MSETAEKVNSTTKKLNKAIKQKEFFDPRIIDDNDSGRQLWSTDSVELALKGLNDGYKLRENPYLKSVRGARLRKANLPFKYTDDEIECMTLCAQDKEFFADNFGMLKDGDNGWSHIKLRPYQRSLLKRYDDNKWNIIMFPRQSGKTTTTVLEIVHFCCFNIDKDCVVIAQSDKVVNETLDKIKEAFSGLPFFMQPGFISFSKKGFVLDNGCRLSIGIASESVVQGFSLDLLYIDEFAYIKPSMVRKFWNNIYPSLVNNPNSRCIITSTPNGRNMFWELWSNAESKTNKFIPYRIYWHDVPGRDEQFKIDTIANVGIEGWEMGFECSFDTQLRSIFNSPTQKKLRGYQLDNEKLWSKDNDAILGRLFDFECIDKSVIKYNWLTDYFLFGIDLGEGLEQDSTIFKIKKIEWSIEKKCLVYKSVAIFKSNEISVEDFAELFIKVSRFFDKTHIRAVVENNTYGGEFFSHIKSLKTYERKYSYFSNSIFAQFMRDTKKDFEYGIRWNAKNKKLAVKSFSNLVTSDVIQESHSQSIEEYLNFGRQKNDTYAAQYGHDDLVMADVTISHYLKNKNTFSNEFLKSTENKLRIIFHDEDPMIVKQREEEKRKKDNVYRYNGMELRNSAEHVDLHLNDDIYLFGML